MTAMETFMPLGRTGSLAPWRAGGSVGNHLPHSSFMPAKSVSSARMKVALTTMPRELPAASRMASTFLRHWRVCSWMVSPTTLPAVSKGPWPETNTKPPAFTAWL